MSNGHVCCAVQICCPPGIAGGHDRRARALATMIAQGGDFHPETASARNLPPPTADHLRIAEFVLANFDLVPRGVGEAIAVAYGPIFAKAQRAAIARLTDPTSPAVSGDTSGDSGAPGHAPLHDENEDGREDGQ